MKTSTKFTLTRAKRQEEVKSIGYGSNTRAMGVLEGYLLALYYVLALRVPQKHISVWATFPNLSLSPETPFPEFIRLVQKPCFRTASCPEFMWYVPQSSLKHVNKKKTVAVWGVTPCSPVDDTNVSHEKLC
jgi:hypothetical protein